MASRSTRGSKSATTTRQSQFFARRADNLAEHAPRMQASLTDNEDNQEETHRGVFYGKRLATRSTPQARKDRLPRKARKSATNSDSEDSLYSPRYELRSRKKPASPMKLESDQGNASKGDLSPVPSQSSEEVAENTDKDEDMEGNATEGAEVNVQSKGKSSNSARKESQSAMSVEFNNSSNQTPVGNRTVTSTTKEGTPLVKNTTNKEPESSKSSAVPEKRESLALTPRYINKKVRYRIPTLDDCVVLDVHSTLLLKKMREVLDKAFAFDDPVTEDVAVERWIKVTQSDDWLEMCRSWLCFFVSLKSMFPLTPNGFIEEHSMALLTRKLAPAKQVWCRQVLARANICLFFQTLFFGFLSVPASLGDIYKAKSGVEPNALCQMTFANLTSSWQGRIFNPNNHILELNNVSKKLIEAIRYFVPYVVYVSDTAMDESLLDFLVTVLTWGVFANSTVIGMGDMIKHTQKYFESITDGVGTLHISMLPSSQPKGYRPRFPSPYFNPKNQLKRRLQLVKSKLEGATKETLYTRFHWHYDFGNAYRYLLGVLTQISEPEKELAMVPSPTTESVTNQPQAPIPNATSVTSPSKSEAELDSEDLPEELNQLRRVSRWAESKVKEKAKDQIPLIPFTRSYRQLYATVIPEPQWPDKRVSLHRFNEKVDLHRARSVSSAPRTHSPLRTKLPLMSASPKLTTRSGRLPAEDIGADDSDASSTVSIMMGTDVDNQVTPMTQDTQDARPLLESTPLAASRLSDHATPETRRRSKRKSLPADLNRYRSPTRQKKRKSSVEPSRIHRSPVGLPRVSVEIQPAPPSVTGRHNVDLSLYPPSRYGKRSPLWTAEEYYYLEKGMRDHGTRWSCILADYGEKGRYNRVLSQRKNLALKDKARNIRLWREANGIPLGIYQIACSNAHWAK
ncbi:hypothetical protein IWQ62_003124 [Dispira parvispora]|uniref:Myb-like domain-containing protein n=1 Tax=Dispira parvispora TaxID=1520584 RepID=A0A9W8AUJ8_9FUNG|nr:hypothetical protein IWQ62_003124 [Dispira parvispora]